MEKHQENSQEIMDLELISKRWVDLDKFSLETSTKDQPNPSKTSINLQKDQVLSQKKQSFSPKLEKNFQKNDRFSEKNETFSQKNQLFSEEKHESFSNISPLKENLQENESNNYENMIKATELLRNERVFNKKTQNNARNPFPQIIDEDTENFRIKLDNLINIFKNDALKEFMSMKKSLLETQVQTIKSETERYLNMYEEKHAQVLHFLLKLCKNLEVFCNSLKKRMKNLRKKYMKMKFLRKGLPALLGFAGNIRINAIITRF